MSLSYRDATLDDLPAIVAIYNSTVPSRLVTADLSGRYDVQASKQFRGLTANEG